MKLGQSIRRGQFLNLRRQRDARTVNELEKIGARVARVRATSRQQAQTGDDQQLQTLHAFISRFRRKITSRFPLTSRKICLRVRKFRQFVAGDRTGGRIANGANRVSAAGRTNLESSILEE